MIEVKDLTKRYGGHLAVDHLNFRVETGQIYGFLGPNGAGKSTTMNMMTGYLAATEGEVLINGYNILEEPEEARKQIGYLPEFPPLYQEMTVGEYMKFAAALKQLAKKQRGVLIDQAMELAHIQDVKDRLIRNLSKGYKQRVGLAQAVLGFPEVMILDEPTVGLDPRQIIEMRDVIKSLGSKHTVILSSHILSEVSAVCDHIMIISHGRLAASGTPDNLIHRMEGAREIELTVKGGREQAEQVLRQVEELEDMELTPSVENQCTDVRLRAKQGADVREKLFFAFADARVPLLSMRMSDKSLEDVFIELTEREAAEYTVQSGSAERRYIRNTQDGAVKSGATRNDIAEQRPAVRAGADRSDANYNMTENSKTGRGMTENSETENDIAGGANDGSDI